MATPLLVVAAIASCRQIVGVDDRIALDPCDTCMELQDCATASEACQRDDACTSRSKCFAACAPGAADCISRCTNASVYGLIEPVAAYEACRATKCAAACNVTCAQFPFLTNDPASQSCTACIGANCCAAANACASDERCVALNECIRTQTTFAGASVCRQRQYADANPTLAQLETCAQNNCSKECAYGNYWQCEGHVTPPVPTTDTVTTTMSINDLEALDQPIPGVQVRVCPPTDPECISPVFEGVSDANGQLDITVNVKSKFGRIGFSGYSFLDDPSGTYIRAINRWYPALASDKSFSLMLMAKPSTIATIAAVLGVRADPARGQVLVFVEDCASHQSENVTITVEPSDVATRIFYVANGTPSRSATATDSQGVAIVVNAMPGPLTITMTPRSLGHANGSARTLVQAGALSQGVVQPSPL